MSSTWLALWWTERNRGGKTDFQVNITGGIFIWILIHGLDWLEYSRKQVDLAGQCMERGTKHGTCRCYAKRMLDSDRVNTILGFWILTCSNSVYLVFIQVSFFLALVPVKTLSLFVFGREVRKYYNNSCRHCHIGAPPFSINLLEKLNNQSKVYSLP